MLDGFELCGLTGREGCALGLLNWAIVAHLISWHGFDGDEFTPVALQSAVEPLLIVGLKLGHDEDACLDNAPHGLLGKRYRCVGTIEVDIGFELFAEVERILEGFHTGGDVHLLEVYFAESTFFDTLCALSDGEDTILIGVFYILCLHSEGC